MSNVAAVRRFNRFYTQKIGVLDENVYGHSWSLTEARILYEVAHGERVTASQIAATLGLDPGYLSRMVKHFEKQNFVRRTVGSDDRRKSVLTLTTKGAHEFARINQRSDEQVAEMIGALSHEDEHRLVSSMQAIEKLLGAPTDRHAPFLLRPPAAGDLGWVVQRHGVLYAQEYGWNEEFEALVADIVSKFVRHFEPKRERCWIAESEGENVGCVFVVKKSERIAQLRMLLVEPAARGRGIGQRLVQECIRFARQQGYQKMILWTNDVLHAARHIYERNGFELVKEDRHHSFGHDLVGQTWELEL